MRKAPLAFLVVSIGTIAATPSVAQDKCKPLRDNMDLFMDLALVSTEYEGKAGIKVKFESLRNFGLEAGGGGAKFVGAARSLADDIEALQNDKIRAALEPVKKALLACVLSAIEEQSNAAPNPLNLKFTLRFKAQDAKFLDAKNVVVGVRRPPREFPELPARSIGDWLFDTIGMPRSNEKLEVYFSRQVNDSHETREKTWTEFCLRRKSPLPTSGGPFSAMHCEEGKPGTPCKFDISDPGWVEFCPLQAQLLPWRLKIIGTAEAAVNPVSIWSAPSLLTLRRQDAQTDMGYTEFEIASSDLRDLDADSFSVALWANDAEIRINGLRADMARQRLDPGKNFSYAFGLQNLNFTGETGGCDQLRAEITFYREGEPLGEPYTLTRSYVALRDAETVNGTVRGRSFVWRGVYRKPGNAFDQEVFASSVTFGPQHPRLKTIADAREAAAKLQRAVNDMGFTFEGKKVVGVVRPPLTKNSFGIALGVQEQSQQIRFTFTKSTANRLLNEVRQFRGRSGERSLVRQAVMADAFVYPVNKADAKSPSGICTF